MNIRIISRDNDPLKLIRQDPLPSSSIVTLPEHSEGSTEESFQCAQSSPQRNPTQESTAPSSQLSAHEDSGENNQEIIERTQGSPNDQNEKCKAEESSKEEISPQSDNNPIALPNLHAPPDSATSSTNEHCQERIEVAQTTISRNSEENLAHNGSESPADGINLQTHNDSRLLITLEDPVPSKSRLSTVENSGESIENPVEFAHFTPLTNNEGKEKFDGEGAPREKDDPMPDKPASCDNEFDLKQCCCCC